MHRSPVVLSAVLAAAFAAAAWCEPIPTDAPPHMTEGRLMVPMRALFQWLGADVHYDAASGKITGRRGGTVVELWAGKNEALVNGTRTPLDAPPEMKDGRAFVPLRFVCEALWVQVRWDAGEGMVRVRDFDREGTFQLGVISAPGATPPPAAPSEAPTPDGGPDDELGLLLHQAALNGDAATVTRLLQQGADVNARDRWACTPLHRAGWHDRVQVARVLLAHGADVNAADEQGETPLHWAAERGHAQVARVLLASGPDVNARARLGWTPLHVAASFGHTQVAGLLLEHGAEVDVRARPGWSPLHLAASLGHSETAKLLLEHGADVNARDDEDATPLHRAAFWGRTGTARVLVECGAEVNARGAGGATPLDVALREGHPETADLLRRLGGLD